MLGNQYGKSVTHPVRRFEPTSQQVQSDQEYNEEWQGKLAAVPQFLQVAYEELSDPVTTMDNVDKYQNNVVPFAGEYGRMHHSVGGPGVQDITYPTSPGASLGMTTKYRNEANPEWHRLKNEMEAAMHFRQQNQTAQQQAYNGMLDQGQKNGVMGPGYSNPGFGRVDGQAQNPYSVDPGSNNMNWAAGYDVAPTGVYDPLQQTQETFWGL